MSHPQFCPCQAFAESPKSYEACCKPFHDGNIPSTCEQLMRSRYSAYALGLTDYLKQTWHPSTCPVDLIKQSEDKWVKLEVLKSTKNTVHFKATFREDLPEDIKPGFACLEETSNFVFEQERWWYVDGNARIERYKQNRNDVCLCGSGKKYKKCCGS